MKISVWWLGLRPEWPRTHFCGSSHSSLAPEFPPHTTHMKAKAFGRHPIPTTPA
ncbi:hypothetical protein [Streptomyces sp. NPDC019890]|uniref:hypothetical protein n=1 Tax=Streptomyces sp. NPDC019890 TaxID=3365064 RepID=UPI00384C9176